VRTGRAPHGVVQIDLDPERATPVRDGFSSDLPDRKKNNWR
jgi:hypothetical protein